MKRENFVITSDDDSIRVVKHKWNSSIREIEALIKEIAIRENTVYTLVDSASIKEGFSFVQGHRIWQSKSGKIVNFFIVKEQE